MKFTPRFTKKNHNISDESVTRKSFEILFSFVVIVTFAILLISFSVDAVARFAPISFGRSVGGALQGAFIGGLDQGFDVSLQQIRVEKIFEELRVHLVEDHEILKAIVIANDEVENAFALPGGQVVITSGLMKHFKTDNEIAMILAHELGHQSNRDYLRGLGRGVVIGFAFWLVGDSTGIDVASTVNQLMALNFSRKQETAADTFAIELLHSTYGHVGGALEIYKVLGEIQSKSMGPQMEILSTHPDPDKRVKFLQGYIHDKKWQVK
jgi:Zn-dependent protease with chaperone function